MDYHKKGTILSEERTVLHIKMGLQYQMNTCCTSSM